MGAEDGESNETCGAGGGGGAVRSTSVSSLGGGRGGFNMSNLPRDGGGDPLRGCGTNIFCKVDKES